MRDPHLLLSGAVALPAIAVAAFRGAGPLALVLAGSLLLVLFELGLAGATTRRRLRGARADRRHLVRLAVAVAYVAFVVQATALDDQRPLVALYLPPIALAAVFGTTEVLAIGLLAAVAYFGPDIVRPHNLDETTLSAIALSTAALVLAVGSRRTVVALERAVAQIRAAAAAERRRSRQLAGIETVGRILAAEGTTSSALDEVMGVLSERFGYRYVSIYLQEGRLLRLGAQRGYTHVVDVFDGTYGVVGRLLRTRELQYVPDVSVDPDYMAADPEVRSEISAPLLSGDELLGVVNVESEARLDESDVRLVAAVAERLAAAVVLGRERLRLAERVRLLASLHGFATGIARHMEAAALHEAIVEGVSSVVPADLTVLTTLDRASGTYRVAAVRGIDPATVGSEIKPGEGMAGRAIRDRTTVAVEDFRREAYPAAVPPTAGADAYAATGVPLIREGAVIGALTMGRTERGNAFTVLELEVLELLASQAALALANVELHAELAELAVRDALTGLFNRRHFDASFERLVAGQVRRPPEERSAVAILFDLDHFGQLNKQHGHQVGDAVLRTFGDVLRSRFRASDLVARYGGEEFVVVLEDTSLDDAVAAANEVRERFAELPVEGAEGAPIHVTVSAGCAALGPDVGSGESLLRTADVALFMAKRAGRDRVVSA